MDPMSREVCHHCRGYAIVATSPSTLNPNYRPCGWCHGRGWVFWR